MKTLTELRASCNTQTRTPLPLLLIFPARCLKTFSNQFLFLFTFSLDCPLSHPLLLVFQLKFLPPSTVPVTLLI